MKPTRLIVVFLALLLSSFIVPEMQVLTEPALTRRFYEENGGAIFWMNNDEIHGLLRRNLLRLIDSCRLAGLNPSKYHREAILKLINGTENTASVPADDALFTDAALSLGKDLFAGVSISKYVSYDELSAKHRPADEQFLINGLLSVHEPARLTQYIASLEPADSAYLKLKAVLADRLKEGDRRHVELLSIAMNLHRWISHFRLQEYIAVKILPAKLQYFKNDSQKLEMKVVVGKPATRTPRFAAHCDKVILYPYWHVPASIAPELWRVILKDRRLLQVMNLQILDKNGRIVDPKSVTWSAYNKYNVPYRLRQSTGCDNALGVIKFNLTSPFGVYLHDTNLKPVFSLQNRYFSHGCIRIEKPIELGNYLTDNKIDSNLLAACIKNREPQTITFEKPVPVFVIYTPCDVNELGIVQYYEDAYGLLQ